MLFFRVMIVKPAASNYTFRTVRLKKITTNLWVGRLISELKLNIKLHKLRFS